VSVRTLVFEPFETATTQLMVEIWDDGHVTIATRFDSSDIWGRKVSPIIDDDGDRIKTDEFSLSDEQFAVYLTKLRERTEGTA
jgi:hypothetical protein